jgi:hypothetical protein
MLIALLVEQALAADTTRCSWDGVARTRVVLATAPWREGTLVAEGCLVNSEHAAEGDWQQLVFVPNNGASGWTRRLGAQDATGEVWWTSVAMLLPRDVDEDRREEVVLEGVLSDCGEGGCVSGTALLAVWPGVADRGSACGRRGFEEGQLGRLLVWENARYDVPGWPGPSWVRTSLERVAPGELRAVESWTALPPAGHDPLEFVQSIVTGAGGPLPHCAGPASPGL